jgi:transcriptional regulator with XRE-family HTH domain
LKKTENIPIEQKELLLKIGKKILELRKDRKLSYEDIAIEIGLNRTTYNLMEQGKLNFQFSTLMLILKYHNITVSKFFEEL